MFWIGLGLIGLEWNGLINWNGMVCNVLDSNELDWFVMEKNGLE